MNNTGISRVFPAVKSLSINRVFPITSRTIVDKIYDCPTHTGQQWNCDDYRMVRFTNAPKQVNPNWAVALVAEVAPKKIPSRIVWCDGGSGPEGHPRIFINLDKPGDHSCGYCGLRFIKEEEHH